MPGPKIPPPPSGKAIYADSKDQVTTITEDQTIPPPPSGKAVRVNQDSSIGALSQGYQQVKDYDQSLYAKQQQLKKLNFAGGYNEDEIAHLNTRANDPNVSDKDFQEEVLTAGGNHPKQEGYQ